MKTHSQAERKAYEHEEESPTLIGQLKLIRDEWGDGFDEDVAKPLALIVRSLRNSLEGHVAEMEREVDEAREERDAAQEANQDDKAFAESARGVGQDIADMERGILTPEELVAKWRDELGGE